MEVEVAASVLVTQLAVVPVLVEPLCLEPVVETPAVRLAVTLQLAFTSVSCPQLSPDKATVDSHVRSPQVVAGSSSVIYVVEVIVTFSAIVGSLIEIEIEIPEEVSEVIGVKGDGIFTGEKAVFILMPPVVTVREGFTGKEGLVARPLTVLKSVSNDVPVNMDRRQPQAPGHFHVAPMVSVAGKDISCLS